MPQLPAFRRLDLEKFPRRAHFEYFKGLGYPYTGISANVDVTKLTQLHRSQGLPFFLTLLYQVSCAANAVPELRQRISGDGIIEFERCDTSHTVARADGTYVYCRLSSDLPLEAFLARAQAIQEECKSCGSIDDGEDVDSLLFISSLPWISYTALVQAVPFPADSNPRISWGRSFAQDGRTLLPLSILCHHALVDGRHIAQFYDQLNARLSEL